MAQSIEYIQEDDLLSRWSDFKQAAIALHQPFDEFERIARNQPHPSIAKGLPKVTDGTLAALIQEQPKRVIQQVPTGQVTGANDTLNIIAGYILQNEIIPNNDEVAALIQKSWAAISKALTYGSQPALVQMVSREDYFGSDFTLPYIKDVFLEPGKLSDRASNVIMVRTWWTEQQIDAIIAKEQRLKRRSKARGDEEPYAPTWDIGNLKRAKKAVGAKAADAQTPNEKGKELDQGYIELVIAFQMGKGNLFYTFSPDLPKDDNVVRRKPNKDPRGKMPIHYLYANVDLSNPLGRGSVELSGGMQNLLDSEVQSYQYMRALLINPPLEIKGNVPVGILKYAPAAQWRLGSDPLASATPVKLETASLQQFPENYGLIKSQILNLNSSTDTSVSSEVGNPGFSKTDAGVKANEQKLGISDNYMRKQYEDFIQEVFETEINLYFAERSGTQELQVDDETADKLRDIDTSLVNKENKVRINYDTETANLHFQIDAGSSEVEDDTQQIQGLQQLLADAAKDPTLGMEFLAVGKAFNKAEVYQQLFERYKLTGIDKIITDIPTVKDPNTGEEVPDPQIVASLQAQMNPQSQDGSGGNAPDPSDLSNHPLVKMMESLAIKFTDLPEDSKQKLLDSMDLHSDELSPAQQGLNIEKAKVVGSQLPPPIDPNAAADRQAQMESQQQSQAAEQQQAAQQPQTTPVKKPLTTSQKPAVPLPPGLNQHDLMLSSELKKRGFSDKVIGQALALMKVGTPIETIVQHLDKNRKA